MVKVRTIYEIETRGLLRRFIDGKKGIRPTDGLVVIEGKSYAVNPTAARSYPYKRLMGFARGLDTFYRYIEGDPTPIPQFGQTRDKEYAGSVLSAFARSRAFDFLRPHMDPLFILAVFLIIANMVLGAIIWNLVR